jgi:Xaa-Pro dipeptidase
MTPTSGIPWAPLFAAHVAVRQKLAAAALAAAKFDAFAVSSGVPFTYFSDDQEPQMRETPHFAHWTPLRGPHHLLAIRPGSKPKLARFAPEDYWYEQAPLGSPFWAGEFEVHEALTREAAWNIVKSSGRVAYIGDEPDAAKASGFAPDCINPPSLIARLDWDRSFKTEYEVTCMEKVASWGHRAALAAFDNGASELEIHLAYVTACNSTEIDLPYPTIIALDEKGATLHYMGKRTQRNGRVLLIDAGAKHLGYCSDITRTWTRKECDPVFRELVKGVDKLQRKLCDLVLPGLPYPDLHNAAHVMIGDLLHDIEVLTVGGEDASERGLTRPFFPHGLGHFLGIQVHDIAGRQKEPAGGTNPPDARHPYLRTTRVIAEDQVFTVEPGVYFIEMLLRQHRSGADAEYFNWPLIERLAPFGGVRIEDNVLVTKGGHRNLTRPHI